MGQCKPFYIQKKVFGGSGYDIACAQKLNPITYQLSNQEPIVSDIVFTPKFHEHLFFVYMNQKQNSRTSIQNHYLGANYNVIRSLDSLTNRFINSQNEIEFQNLMLKHENIISKLIGISPVQQTTFSDYDGAVKSLGAWGGDFVLACGPKTSKTYFKAKRICSLYSLFRNHFHKVTYYRLSI